MTLTKWQKQLEYWKKHPEKRVEHLRKRREKERKKYQEKKNDIEFVQYQRDRLNSWRKNNVQKTRDQYQRANKLRKERYPEYAAIASKKWKERHPDYFKSAEYIENGKKYQKKRYSKLKNDPEFKRKNNENNKRFREQNKEYFIKYNKEHTEHTRIYKRERYANDIQFKLKHILRSRLQRALGRRKKLGSAVRDCGCTLQELITHLENQFEEGMTWDNWKRNGWHVDHIKPLSSFDLTDPEQLKEACHYTNLQPLWGWQNISKGAKINWSVNSNDR